MRVRLIGALILLSMLGLATIQATAQTPGSPSDQSDVAKQIEMLRQSVQALDATLNDIGNRAFSAPAKGKDPATDTQSRISNGFALLTQAEQRAEGLRRQLLELIEKETLYRTRITQLDEDMRPESVERSLSTYGTTRTAEIRETRRRVLETERRGYQNLLTITIESRTRLEEEVRQADMLAQNLRRRMNPLLEKEIEKLNPQP